MDWLAAEECTARFAGVQQGFSFEVFGNQDGARILLGTENSSGVTNLSDAVRATHQDVIAEPATDPLQGLSSGDCIQVVDLFPAAPYHHAMHQSKTSHLGDIIQAFARIDTNDIGIFQVLAEPVRDDWLGNIKMLVQAEGILGARVPGGKTTASTRKDPRKPLFAARVRFATTSQDRAVLESLLILGRSFVYAGKAMRVRKTKEFLAIVDHSALTASIRRGASESMINECVKAGLHVTLANQETGQLDDSMLKAALSVPNILLFNLNYLDAKKLAPLFNGRVTPQDLLDLQVGEVHARIDNHLTSFRVAPPPKKNEGKTAAEIIKHSRAQYYVPIGSTQKSTPQGRRELDTFD